VTSRTRLTGLAAAEGARLARLDALSDAESREVLSRRISTGRVAAEPVAAAELVSLCGRLPLALTIVAARAADRPGFSLATLVAELREGRRLGALDTGDATTSVRAVFQWSYQQLNAPAARLFRLLSLHPGPDVSADAAACLAALPHEEVRGLMRGLVRSCLLTEPAPGRYAFHDLLRVYARQQAETTDTAIERDTALTRAFDHYLAMAGAAADTLAPGERQRPKVRPPDPGAPPVDTPDAARSWLDAERATLVAMAGHCASHSWPRHAIGLAAILFRYLDDGGHYPEAMAVQTRALDAAQQTGDRAAQADALRRRCAVDFRQGRHEQALAELEQALAFYRELGDRNGQVRTLSNHGIVLRVQGRHLEALDCQRQALALSRQDGDDFALALTLDSLGVTLCWLGRYQESARHHRQALDLFRRLGERRSEAFALANLGDVLRRLGHLHEAADCHQQALAINREIRCRYGEADALNSLGRDWSGRNRHEIAAGHHRQALALYRELACPSGEADSLNGLAEALTGLGRLSQARTPYRRALTLASQVSDRHQEARAHEGLARVEMHLKDIVDSDSRDCQVVEQPVRPR
jgi:tetratricopeptide (TPR) repeat protein